MRPAILGTKIGMTRYFMEDGKNIPVTVIQVGPCAVTQIKTTENDGYNAVQLAYAEIKPRRSTMPVIGHDAKAGVTPKRHHREFRLPDDKATSSYELGQTVDVSVFEDVKYVDVVGVSKGKGFQGGVKRHHFAGLEASHGVKRAHRSVGSISSHSSNLGTGPKLKKGKRMPGHMGHERVSVRSLDVIKIDTDRNLLLVKGAVPGPNRGMLMISQAKRLNRKKANH